jgi:hypothetical protein
VKLRTFTGVDKECLCACGCNQKLLARPDVQVVVDMDSPKWKRDRYLPGHAGNGYGSVPYAQRAKKEAPPPQAPAPTPPAPAGPTPQGPSPASPQPQVDPAPVPTPKVVTGTAPSLADNRPWKILQVTISVGDYSSVKAGVADFGRENETLAQLGARLVAELTQDVKTELDVVHQVQAGKALSVPTPGVASTPATPSPAQAGVPQGAAATATSKPAFTPASALAAHYERERAYEAAMNDPETLEAIRRVQMELGDVSAVRSVKKCRITQTWLETRGYERIEEADSRDLSGLRELLVKFDMVNEPEKFTAPKVSGQGCGTPVYG